MPAKNKAKSKKVTYVAIVLDKSGSMLGLQYEAVKSVNDQIKTLQSRGKNTGDVYVSLIQFADKPEVVYENINVDGLEELTRDRYSPYGSTAMYDAIGTAISKLETIEETDDTAYLVCVISDGEENASKEYKAASIAQKISALQETNKWTFTYMLANQDVRRVAQTLNAPMSNVSSFSATSAGMVSASYAITGSMTSYMSARAYGATAVLNFYDGTNGVTTK